MQRMMNGMMANMWVWTIIAVLVIVLLVLVIAKVLKKHIGENHDLMDKIMADVKAIPMPKSDVNPGVQSPEQVASAAREALLAMDGAMM